MENPGGWDRCVVGEGLYRKFLAVRLYLCVWGYFGKAWQLTRCMGEGIIRQIPAVGPCA